MFVDDTNFYTNRPNYKETIQLIIDLYTKLYEAIGENTADKDNVLLLEMDLCQRIPKNYLIGGKHHSS